MKKIKFYIFTLLIIIINLQLNAQEFQNGDLEGNPTTFSILPDHWEAIPFFDLNCEANAEGQASPDLVSQFEPSIENGIFGLPNSGNSFVFGSHASNFEGETFHEGIMQYVDNFEIGKSYEIQLYQSVLKGSNCIDKSGSWMIILNDSIIGVTENSFSEISYDDGNLEWDFRSIQFTAFEESYWIKFLPIDDDESRTCSNSVVDGGLGMAIDNISISTLTSTSEIFKYENIKVFPNPIKESVNINLKDIEYPCQILVLNSVGKIISKFVNNGLNNFEIILNQPKGIYFVIVKSKHDSFMKKIIKN